jgi:VWFA-related protein
LPKIAVLAVLIALASIPVLQQAECSDDPSPGEYRISVNVGLVILPVIVTDRKGQAVSGLGKTSFQVFDDGRPQQISLFESEDVPVTVGLVIDNSGSMSAKRPEVIAAADDFARSSNPQDQMFVVNFNQNVSMGLPDGLPFTSDAGQLLAAVSREPAAGNTALYDGLATALRHIRTGTASRKALVVISDGADNSSTITLRNVLDRAQATNAQIYTIGIFDNIAAGKAAGVLRALARVTGGKAYFPQYPSQIAEICREIALDLRHQYTLGYHPTNSAVGSYHAIRVTAKGMGDARLHVSTRAGYWMPDESEVQPPA